MTVEPLFDRAAIEGAFRRLGDRLLARGLTGDIYVVGAAMALAYDATRVTRDIDALVQPHGAVFEEAWNVADELGLPHWWLNEQASAYVSTSPDSKAPRVFEHPGLRVSAASPEHLLAMKVLASRARDLPDIKTLSKILGLRTADEVLAICEAIFPDEQPPARARPLIEEALADGDTSSGRT